MDRRHQRRQHRLVILRSSYHYREEIRRHLIEREIKRGPRGSVQLPLLQIVHNAYDLNMHLEIVVPRNLLADRILTGKELARECLIDDRHKRRLLVFVLSEFAAAQQARSQRVKVSGADLSIGRFIVLLVSVGTSYNSKVGGTIAIAQRQGISNPRGLHAG